MSVCHRGLHTYIPDPNKRGCRECYRIYHAKYYRANRAMFQAHGRASRLKDPARHKRYDLERRRDRFELVLIVSAKRRAKRNGIPFSITVDDIRPLPIRCPVLGIELKPNIGGKAPAANSPSLDRIIPSIGYVPGNVRVISYRANAIKHNATSAELRVIADWIDTETGADWLGG